MNARNSKPTEAPASEPLLSVRLPPPGEGAFDLLHPHLQRWVYDAGWESLHDTQARAIPLLSRPGRDVLISATTAGGKSEAAFLPILSHLLRHPTDRPGLQVLSLAPTKALLNDQHARLINMCRGTELAIHLRHGDVPDNRRRLLMKNPSGILMTTPESVEALFVRHGHKIPTLFGTLDYVVVDELHSFIGSERGAQLLSLLNRIEVATGRRAARVGLSATLGDPQLAATQLRPDNPHDVALVSSDSGGKPLRLSIRGYREAPSEAQPVNADDTARNVPGSVTIQICRHLFEVLNGRDNLVFANSRGRVEEVADLLRRACDQSRLPNEFFPHHGNLPKEFRESVEAALRDPARPTTAVATSTLEMGIDVGSVTSIAQIGPPPSVSALRQRLGRSGRRGDPAVLRAYVSETALDPRTSISDQLRNGLVQTTSMVLLLLEGYCEPPAAAVLHSSTLVQQVLSVIAQHGGVNPAEAYAELCGAGGPFSATHAARFKQVLRSLADRDIITQAGDGTVLLGPAGDRIVNHYDFYTAFKTPDEYRLLHAGQLVGTKPIDYPLRIGDRVIFSGMRWKVTDVDNRKRTIDLTPTAGGQPPLFGGDTPDVHDRVRTRMRSLLGEPTVPAFLDPVARELLAEGRATYARLGLAARSLVPVNDEQTLLLPWAGSRTSHTLTQILRPADIEAHLDGLVINCHAGQSETLHALQAILDGPAADATELARHVDARPMNKYDHLLDGPLVDEDYGRRAFDLPSAHHTTRRILREHEAA